MAEPMTFDEWYSDVPDDTPRDAAEAAWVRQQLTITALQSELRDARERLARVGEVVLFVDAKRRPYQHDDDYAAGEAEGMEIIADELRDILDGETK